MDDGHSIVIKHDEILGIESPTDTLLVNNLYLITVTISLRNWLVNRYVKEKNVGVDRQPIYVKLLLCENY